MPISGETTTHYIPHYYVTFNQNGWQNPSHTVKTMTVDQFVDFNVEPPASIARSVNVDVSALNDVTTTKSISPVVLGLVGFLILACFAAALAIPFAFAQGVTVTITTTTTVGPVVFITRAGDSIIGVYNRIAGGSIGGVNASYSTPSEYPPFAIDNSSSTKYLNYGINVGGLTAYQPGLNTGFYVSPVSSSTSIAIALLFATANDVPDRDPITVTLEGTNVTSSTALNLGSSWTLIYSGPTGINSTTDPGRSKYLPEQNFSNTLAFRSYRVLVTSRRGNTSCVQYAEAPILGYV